MSKAAVQTALHSILRHLRTEATYSEAFIQNTLEDLARTLAPSDNYSSELKPATAIKPGSPADITERAVSAMSAKVQQLTPCDDDVLIECVGNIMRQAGRDVTAAVAADKRAELPEAPTKKRNACPLPQGYTVRLGTDACLPIKLRPVMIPDDNGQWLSAFDVAHLLESFNITVTKRG